jgi:hypothetical protein
MRQVICEALVAHSAPKYARFHLRPRPVPSDDESTVTPVDSICYVECDVPPGQTLAEWRRERAGEGRRPSRLRLRRRAAIRALRRACGLS